ncbi:Gfo/Idh/MocA family protein [Ammoniphilus sp. YIM 78166]|uniref:Gfo/Idh/MocA family protein n=1 Tax=Ammoniphilus sp. YIM 78166 TaxID=1644106 RepID=UPI00107024E5|nr:Gfo/Idh/MocA family oxidoreductase [Ammoniphilus sp. YIM 78166]
MTNSKVRIAVIGLGRVSRTHIDGIRYWPDHCELAAVVDVQENLAKAFSEEYGVPYYLSVDEALKDPQIDAVVICLPHSLHAPITIKACEAGKHVLVEKVMANTVAEGQSMVDAAEKHGVNLMVAQSRRFFLALQEAKKRIGEIGRVNNLLYTFACYFDVNVAPKWWQSKEATGGLVYPMLGSHSIDFTLWMLEDRRPVSVYAQGCSNNPDFEGDDDVTIVIGFEDGTHATNFLSINNRPSRHEGLIIGKEGSIYFTQTGDHIGFIGTAETDLYIKGDLVMTGEPLPHNFAVQMKEFVDSIREHRTPMASGQEILMQLKIIDAAQRSAAEKRVILL